MSPVFSFLLFLNLLNNMAEATGEITSESFLYSREFRAIMGLFLITIFHNKSFMKLLILVSHWRYFFRSRRCFGLLGRGLAFRSTFHGDFLAFLPFTLIFKPGGFDCFSFQVVLIVSISIFVFRWFWWPRTIAVTLSPWRKKISEEIIRRQVFQAFNLFISLFLLHQQQIFIQKA